MTTAPTPTPVQQAKLDALGFVAAVFPGRELFAAPDGTFHQRTVGTVDDWWPFLTAPELRPIVRTYLRQRGLPADARAVRFVIRALRWVLPALADANSYQNSRNLAGIESNEQQH
jgi:hypothetical protein